MPTYQAESFYRAKISSSIAAGQTCPITIRVSKLPTRTSWLLTISPNTEYEEMVEYGNINWTTMTIDITKRGINPASTLLSSNGTDYNVVAFQKDHTQNDIIRWDVNHIHINQAIGNTTLASNSNPWISKLSVAPVDVNNPIVVGDNDPRISVPTDSTIVLSDVTTNNANTSRHGFMPKLPWNGNIFYNWAGGFSAPVIAGIQYQTGVTVLSSSTTSFSRSVGFQPKVLMFEFSENFQYGQTGTGYIDNNGLTNSMYQSYATTSAWNSSQPIYLRLSDGTFADASVTITATWYDITFPSTRTKDIRLKHIALA